MKYFLYLHSRTDLFLRSKLIDKRKEFKKKKFPWEKGYEQ